MAAIPAGNPRSGSFRLHYTELGKRIVLLYGAVWALGWLLSLVPPEWAPMVLPVVDGVAMPLSELLALHPPGGGTPGGPGFRWWQLVTGPLLYPPGGLGGLVLASLGLGFFGATVERFLGRRRFLELWLAASLGAILGAVILGFVQHPPTVHYGFGAVVLALIVVNCALTPHASVNFFMVVPVKLQWLAIGVAFTVVARTLGMFAPFGSQPGVGGYELGGMAAGWVFWRYRDRLDPRKASRRRQARRLLRAVEDTVSGDSDGPLYH